SDLLGGTFQAEFPIYGVVGVNSPERMRERALELLEQGYRRAQVKVGAYWRQHEAVNVVAALDDQPIYVEQPCRTLAECLEVRRRSSRPFILDESLTDLDALLQAHALGALDAAMLKLSRF